MNPSKVKDYLLTLQQNIVATLENLDGASFRTDQWQREGGGGGKCSHETKRQLGHPETTGMGHCNSLDSSGDRAGEQRKAQALSPDDGGLCSLVLSPRGASARVNNRLTRYPPRVTTE